MNLRILVYSPEAALRDEFTAWGQHEDSFEVQIVDLPEALPEALRSGGLAAVILDDSDGALPLTALTYDLATQFPKARILIFPPPAENDPSEIKDAILHGYLSKPLSVDELNSALRGLSIPEPAQADLTADNNLLTNLPPLFIVTGTNSHIPGENHPPVEDNPSVEDLDFLKGWLYEEPEVENGTPMPAIETITEPVDAQELPEVPAEALEVMESLPAETNDPASDPEEPTQIKAEITDDVTAASVAAITPAQLQSLKNNLPPAPVSEIMAADDPKHTEGGIPPVNLHSLRLHYSFVLVPRNPQHYLVGELADRLALVLPQVHLKRGWRVTGTSIRPQYMQWFAELPLNTNPVEAVVEIRQNTSTSILSNLPELNSNEDEGSFWAPGYLILSGNLATPPSIIREFIHRTSTIGQSET